MFVTIYFIRIISYLLIIIFQLFILITKIFTIKTGLSRTVFSDIALSQHSL